MREIKCPKCGEVFQVDESGYAAIVKQVRDREFTAELQQREARFASEKENAVKLAEMESERRFHEALARQQAQILQLQGRIEASDAAKKLAVADAVAQKDRELAEREQQIVRLNGEIASEKQQSQLSEKNLKEAFESQLKLKD